MDNPIDTCSWLTTEKRDQDFLIQGYGIHFQLFRDHKYLYRIRPLQNTTVSQQVSNRHFSWMSKTIPILLLEILDAKRTSCSTGKALSLCTFESALWKVHFDSSVEKLEKVIIIFSHGCTITLQMVWQTQCQQTIKTNFSLKLDKLLSPFWTISVSFKKSFSGIKFMFSLQRILASIDWGNCHWKLPQSFPPIRWRSTRWKTYGWFRIKIFWQRS